MTGTLRVWLTALLPGRRPLSDRAVAWLATVGLAAAAAIPAAHFWPTAVTWSAGAADRAAYSDVTVAVLALGLLALCPLTGLLRELSRPACRPGHRTPSRSAVAHAAPRHREATPPVMGGGGVASHQTGRPAVADPGVLKLPAAVCPTVLPRGAAAGTLPARAASVHVSPDIRYWPGRAAVTTPTATRE